MTRWNIRTFTTETGAKPVDEWLLSLTPPARTEVVRTMFVLQQYGITTGMPHVRPMGNGLWELRARDANGIYRILYFHWKGRTFGFLHGFTKKTPTTPKADLDLARQR